MNKFATRLLVVALFTALFVPAWVPVARADCPTLALAQDNSTSGNGRAPSTRFKVNRAVYLILGSELTANNIGSGSVTGIGWNYQTAPGVSGAAPLKVYLQDTTDTTNNKGTSWAGAIVGMTLVHDATTTLPGTAGEFDFLFSGGSPFTHTAGNGIYVAYEWGVYTGTLSIATVVWCNSTGLGSGLKSNQSTTATTQSDTLANSNFRPETWLVAPGAPLVDASVDFVISMGATPQGITGNQTVQATVFQNGDSNLTDTNVHLDISGADAVTEDVNVPSLLKCGTGGSLVTFSPYTPTNLGANAVTASLSVPGDVNSANDSLTQLYEFTPQRYSYEHQGTPADGGIGNSAVIEFVAKFNFTAPAQIDTVDLNFFSATATTYKVVIYGDSGSGTPGTSLYLDASDRTVSIAGHRTIRLPSPLSVAAGNYFVGIQQTNATNASYAFNIEFPVRTNTFFFRTTLGSGTWSEFGATGNNLALNFGLITGACVEPMSIDVTPDASAYNVCNNSVQLTAGATSGGFGNLTYQWTKDGVDIPGATQFTYNASEAAGTFNFNCKVTDDAGCINVLDASNSVVTWGPSAAVSGGGIICAGGSAGIQAALTGAGPWTVNWSDGFVQSGVTTSPATRTVSPGSTTVYTATVSDSNCSGVSTGSATVTVNPLPAETASGASDLSWASTKDSFSWPTNVDAATYNVYRGDGSTLSALLNSAIDSCTRGQTASTSISGLAENPGDDQFYWYLVTGVSAASCEGSAGAATAGNRIVNSSGICP